jgi:Leucine-rich repeat (LRR) protein
MPMLSTLYMSSNFLNGTLPSWLFSLPSLVTLDLNSNQLSGEIGEFKSNSSLIHLTQITYLDLSYNNFIGSIPASLGNLGHITHLDLSNNNFSGEIQLPLLNFGGFQQPHQTNIFLIILDYFNRFVAVVIFEHANAL